MKSIAILGSTGSIGRQTLDIIKTYPSDFKVVALAAGKNNLALLKEQIESFNPEVVSVADARAATNLKELLRGSARVPSITYGEQGLQEVACYASAQLVVSGVVGFLGVLPTAAAVKAGKTIALANKETLVAAGCAIMPLVKKFNARLIPVDSEHSAIYQCMSGRLSSHVRQIWLTGSGGPFRTWSKERIESATVNDALRHPNWSMGPKITIDSATLMNKGLEIIEACWLFDLCPEQVRVIIHPQSIVHSAVEFVDGSVIGQMGVPDMHLPLHYALYWPNCQESCNVPALDLVKLGELTFEEPDESRFPCLALAREVSFKTDTSACALNAANEVAVEAFLKQKIKFSEIPKYIEKVLKRHQGIANPSLEDLLATDCWARQTTNELLGVLAK